MRPPCGEDTPNPHCSAGLLSWGSPTVCRADVADNTPDGYGSTHLVALDLDACKARCLEDESCTGIEHRAKSRGCELWTRPICYHRFAEASWAPMPLDFECFTKPKAKAYSSPDLAGAVIMGHLSLQVEDAAVFVTMDGAAEGVAQAVASAAGVLPDSVHVTLRLPDRRLGDLKPAAMGGVTAEYSILSTRTNSVLGRLESAELDIIGSLIHDNLAMQMGVAPTVRVTSKTKASISTTTTTTTTSAATAATIANTLVAQEADPKATTDAISSSTVAANSRADAHTRDGEDRGSEDAPVSSRPGARSAEHPSRLAR